MTVISDTTTLSSLFAIGRESLLPTMFGDIVIPRQVYVELCHRQGFPEQIDQAISAGWIKVDTATPSKLLETLSSDLDRGEAEAIALAIELKADLLIIDEKHGRRIAETYNLTIIGLLGILIQAKKYGLILALRPILDDLERRAHFRLNNTLRRSVLEKCGEND